MKKQYTEIPTAGLSREENPEEERHAEKHKIPVGAGEC